MKKHNKHSSKSIIRAFSALMVLFPTLLLVFELALPPQYGETFLGEMKYKLQRLQTTQGKRIVLVGGSNIPFGVKSGLLAENFPEYHIVDLGMYADMGTVVMLDWAKTEVHEGDLFILMPEQNSQTLSCYFSGGDVWQAADGAWQSVALLPSRRYPQLAAAFPAFAGKKLYYAVNGSPKPEGIYARSSFNEYGDICYTEREYNIMSEGYNPNDLIAFDQNVISEEFIEEMNAFADHVTKKGASVYYHFPPMNELALAADTTRTSIDAYYDFLQKRLSFPILGNPHRSIMESGWFYDTNFHLNDSGATVFTKYLVEDIRLLLRDTSETAISLPPIPKAPLRLAQGDSSDADCFTYRLEQEGWVIDGLTEKGRASQTLVIPVTYSPGNGNNLDSDNNIHSEGSGNISGTVNSGDIAVEGELPVTGISQTLFVENTTLRELTIQPNIGVLYDGMFQGCTSLGKLLLTGQPSDYSVGSGLMDGADFLIYVPEEMAEHYRRDYSWQEYGAYIHKQ